MKIGHLEIFVSEPMKAKDFYGEILGFQLETIQDEKFVWMHRDGQVILLRPLRRAEASPTYQDAPMAMVFYTDDLPQTLEALKARGLEFRGTDGSPNCHTFTDGDGNWFQLVNPKH